MPSVPRLSTRFHRVRPTTMSELTRSLAAFQRAGRPVLTLNEGHLPGELPRGLGALAADAWRDGHVSYVPGPGMEALREAVVDWLDVREARDAEEVLIAPGSRAACASVISVLAGPGDAVLIDAAAWMIFHQLVSVCGATPVPLVPSAGARRHLKLTAEDLRTLLPLFPGARVLLLANPVNPTAQLYDAEELTGIIDVCAAAGIYVVIDRLYGMLVYDGGRFPYLPPTPAFRDWCVLIDGVARAFRGMGGLRIGWAVGPRDVIEAAAIAQGASCGPADRVSQKVALAAVRAPYDLGLVEELQSVRDVVRDLVAGIPRLEMWPVAGTMFCVLDLSPWLGKTTSVGWVLETSGDLADFLLSEPGVLVTPGEIVGQRGLVRIAFAQKMEVVSEAMDRIGEALTGLA